MFVLVAVILGLIIGFIRGGSLKALFTTKLRLWPLGLIGVILQIGLHVCYGFFAASTYCTIVHFVSYVLILVTLVFNLNRLWCIVTLVGTIANFVVTFLNAGKMPVAQSVLNGASSVLAGSVITGSHCLYGIMDTAATKLWFLGHCVPIPYVGTYTSLYGAVPGVTIGGVVIFVGIIGWIQSRMVAQKNVKPVHFLDEEDQNEFQEMDYLLSGSGKADHQDRFDVDVDEDVFIGVDTTVPTPDSDFYAQDISDDELTEVIPRLTPELIEEIRRKSLLEDEMGYYDDEDSDTKVFTSISDLDVQKVDALFDLEHEEEPESDIRSKSDRSLLNSEDDLFDVPAQFESEKTNQWVGYSGDESSLDRRFGVEPEWVVPSVSQNVKLDVLKDYSEPETAAEPFEEKSEDIKKEWNPNQVERNQYAVQPNKYKAQQSNPYSTFFNKGWDDYNGSSKGHSTDEMLDIWHKVSVEDEYKFKRAEKKDVLKAPVGSVPEENVKENPDIEVQSPIVHSASDFVEAREALARKWDENTPAINVMNLDRTTTERVDSREILRRSLHRKKEQEKANAVAESDRERAGYEKVETVIGGRTVSFWRKKTE